MYPNMIIGKPHLGPEYVPYFYASGRFLLYDLPQTGAASKVRYVPAGRYDFTSDLLQRRPYPRPQTVEQVIRRGYLGVPRSEPETALITDRKETARLGLDDVIGQIRKRYELYDNNIYELEVAKCAAINCLYRHEAYHGPTNSKVEYSVQKRLNDLYQEQREERTNLWRDVSRLRLQLPENAQQYLNAYRKVSILEDEKGDGP
ncbi:MAG: hypothetical protein JRI67_11610 [Deltaproteobacteria bacterium]|nr:hypothetical protein [Deltaproteobacteria bacterium]